MLNSDVCVISSVGVDGYRIRFTREGSWVRIPHGTLFFIYLHKN